MGSAYKKRKYNHISHSIPSKSIDHDSIPPKYSLLYTFFTYIDRFILFYYGKKITSFENIKSYIEKVSKKKFTIEHLEKIKTIYPSAYDYSIQKVPNDYDDNHMIKNILVIKFPLKFSNFKDMDQYIKKRCSIFKDILKEKIKNSTDIERTKLIDDKEINFYEENDDNNNNQYIQLDKLSSLNNNNNNNDENDENALMDRIILGKDHPLITNKENSSPLNDQIKIEPIPESLKDINPSIIYKARQNKKNMDLINDEEYIIKENRRRILLFVREICDKMNSYFVLKGKKTEQYDKMVDHLKMNKRGIRITQEEINECFNVLLNQIDQKWCKIMILNDVKYIKIDKDSSLFINLKNKINEMYQQSII